MLDDNIGQKLETLNHLENALFLVEDLVEAVDSSNQEEVIHAPEEETRGDERQMNDVQEEENGRLTGVFVSGNVVNLSRKTLSEGEVKLLSRGLKFSPTPRDIDKGQLKADLDALKRRMRLK